MKRRNHSYIVELTRAKLLANAGNFTCGLHVERPHTQFTCVTCSLPVKRDKFTCVYAANTSRRIHANCLQLHVNLLEHSGYLTKKYMRNSCKVALDWHTKTPALASKNTRIHRRKHPQSQAKNALLQLKIPAIASKNTRHCKLK